MAKNKELDDIGKLSADLDEKIFGIGKSDSKELNKKEDLRDELSKLADNFHKGNGNSQGNLIELFATVSAKTSYSKGKMVAKDYKDKKEGLEKKLNNETLGYLNQMMMSEKERIMGYRNYTMIHAMIPQIAEAIKTYVDNIISPDDFTKNSFNFSLVGEESNNKTFDANINKLKELYNIEEKVAKYIEESLVNGDLFIFVEKMSDGLASVFLSEDNEDVMSLEKSGDALNIHDLTRTDIVLTEDVLNKIKGARTKDSKLSEAQEIAAFKKDVIAYVDEKFIVTSDTSHFFEDYNTLREDYQALSESTKIEQKNLTDIPLEGLNKTLGKKTKDDTDLSNIRGSIIKKLDPQRIIKLWADGFTYGYYYVDTAANSYMDSPRLKDAGSTFNSLFTLEGGGDGMMKNKQEYMFELLFQSVTKKINKKFVKDNPEFKEIIYNMMTQQELYNKKLKIIYIPPEKVVHFHPSQDNTVEYGKSLYKDVLFTAKLYLSVLISTLMMMLLRGADKRAWYVETGLENDQEAVINRTIQDVKGREIKLNDFGDIQHVLNLVGMFDDYFFPMFDGEKPLDMEIIEGQKMELDNNEFLEYLKKAAISGMGVPPAHLGYTEDIELAKSLTIKFVA